MGCWKNKSKRCGSCFNCMVANPGLVSLKFKLHNGTVITSICLFD